MDEFWKDFYKNYQISSFGRIRNIKTGRILKLRNRNGYKHISLVLNGGKKDLLVHRLVATAFIPNPDNYPQIDHIDGNPSNNMVSNLRWCTPKMNSNNPISLQRKRDVMSVINKKRIGVKMPAYAIENLKKAIKGKRFGKNNPFWGKKHTEEAKRKMSEFRQNTGIPIAQYSKEGNFIKNFQSAAKAARELGIKSPSCITECCRGKRKTIGGFIFKYKSE